MDAVLAEVCAGSETWQPPQAQLTDRRSGGNLPMALDTEPAITLSPTELMRNGCVLVVDDNDAVREMLAELIESGGFCPIQAADADRALTIIGERNDIDALVTDLSMPGADGISLILRARELRSGLPAILLTGYAEETSSVSTIAGGDVHVMRKPVESDLLIEQIFLLIAQARSSEYRPLG